MSTFHYTLEIKENGQWQALSGVVRPFYDTETLDESLDSGKLELSFSRRNEPIKPFTPLRITIENKAKVQERQVIYRLVSDSAINQRSFSWNDGLGGQTRKFNTPELFDHSISTIELTKELEREICDSITFTNYLAHDFVSGAGVIEPINKNEFWNIISYDFTFYGPIAVGGEIKIKSLKDGMYDTPKDGYNIEFSYSKSNTEVVDPNGNITTFAYEEGGTIKTNVSGKYLIKYNAVGMRPTGSGGAPFGETLIYEIDVFDTISQKSQYSITDVINRILECGKTRRKGVEPQRYFLRGDIAQKYSTVTAPEFYITRSTLFEALLQVGGYIHAIPRLEWDEARDMPGIITYDELGGDTRKEIRMFLEGYDCGIGIDEYCGAIDSTVENLVNSRDKVQGSVTEPYNNGYKTIRTESGQVEISNESAVIMTERPIYRIVKLEMGYINDDRIVGDLTPYVFEAAEYGTLTSYEGQYPYAKRYALTYSQGDNKITGLNFRAQDLVSQAFQPYALVNILHMIEIDVPNDVDFKNFAFRVTYVPLVNARVVQKKVYLDEFPENSLIYNQSASTVEAEYYGEHLKGAIAKIGNEEAHVTYKFVKLSDIPKCGELVNGMYVCRVEKEFERLWIKTTLTLTPNFNKLSEFLAIDSNYRLFDVSEKQSVDRYINYGEDVVIGDEIQNTPSKAGIQTDGMAVFGNTFNQNAGLYPVSCSISQGYTETGAAIENPVLHSCLSEAIGNSLMFSFEQADNFSAGFKAIGYSGTKNIQQLVPYGDVYGEIHDLQVALYGNYVESKWSDQTSEGGICNTIPELEEINAEIRPLISYRNTPLIIRKDSRERPIVTLQLHFRVNRKSIVLGTQLAQRNLLVTQATPAAAAEVYFLPYRLNMLRSVLDLSVPGVHRVGKNIGVTVLYADKKILLSGIKNSTQLSFKSWALVDPTCNKFYIGENMDLTPGETTKPIYFTF